MTAVTRYIAACCLGALRWLAPALAFAIGLAMTYLPGGPVLPSVAEQAAWLFPITAWLTVATLNDEDPSQRAITAAAAGGPARAHVLKLMVAGCVGASLALVSLASAYAANPAHFDVHDLAIGAAAQGLSVTGGVALGSLCGRPAVTRAAVAALSIVIVTVLDLVVPFAPPARTVLTALNRARAGQQWAVLGIGAGEVVVVAVVAIGVSARLARARS
jgi:hypothetical protein